jgi:UPF0176 protein
MQYLVTAFYQFVDPADSSWADPAQLEARRESLKARMLLDGVRGTVLLAPEGINSTIVGEEPVLRAFIEHLRTIPQLAKMIVKESFVDHIPFRRTLVKIKPFLIPYGENGKFAVNPARKTGKYVKPAELKQWLDEGASDLVLVDTRNRYEIVKGSFDGAQDWGLRHFRNFPAELEKRKRELEGKKVVMFCTGGIRCEKATAHASDLGLDVYQIDGGILQYFEDVGGAHYKGDCFVFDYRIAVNPALEPVPYSTAFPDGRPVEALDGYAGARSGGDESDSSPDGDEA